jgi:hypothetical protein
MAPAPSTGVTEAESTALESSDSCVIEWVQGLFNEYLEGARPPIRVFQEHVASALRDEQSRERSVQSSLPQTKVT